MPTDHTGIITEYQPKFCKMLLDYAYKHLDVEGFYGAFNIDPDSAEDWKFIHDDWRRACKMAEYKVKDAINQRYSLLFEFALGKKDKNGNLVRPPDFDALRNITFKQTEILYKIEKDTGGLKRKGADKARSNKASNNAQVSDTVSRMVETLVAKPNLDTEE